MFRYFNVNAGWNDVCLPRQHDTLPGSDALGQCRHGMLPFPYYFPGDAYVLSVGVLPLLHNDEQLARDRRDVLQDLES